jgi:hypothetical protein
MLIVILSLSPYDGCTPANLLEPSRFLDSITHALSREFPVIAAWIWPGDPSRATMQIENIAEGSDLAYSQL